MFSVKGLIYFIYLLIGYVAVNATSYESRREERTLGQRKYQNTQGNLTSLEVDVKYSLHQEQSENYSVLRRNRRNDLNLSSDFKDSIEVNKNCGSDDVCIPDLRLIVKPNVDKYLLGSGKRIELDVIVKNEGEDSFESTFYMKIPQGINFLYIINLSDDPAIPVQCFSRSEATNNTMQCDVGNPLPNDKVVYFKVMLQPYNVESMKPSYDFFMKVYSTNLENNDTLSDNVQQLSINISVDTKISLIGWAMHPDIHYNENQYKEGNYTFETDIGPQIVHFHSIKNNGPSNINEAEVMIVWPNETLEGDMLYVMEQPETQGQIKCEHVPKAKALQVKLLPKKYYLHHDREISFSKNGRQKEIVTTSESTTLEGGRKTENSSSPSTSSSATPHYKIIYTSTGNNEKRLSNQENDEIGSRNKRQINDDLSSFVECKGTKCAVVRCTAGPLVKEEEAWIVLRFRVNAATVKKMGFIKPVTVSSMMISRITKVPFIGTPNERAIHTHEVFTNVTAVKQINRTRRSTEMPYYSHTSFANYASTKPPVSTNITSTNIEVFTNVTLGGTHINASVFVWIVVLSACSGALILLLLLFVMYKCRICKRNRHTQTREQQPLNRVHYYPNEQILCLTKRFSIQQF